MLLEDLEIETVLYCVICGTSEPFIDEKFGSKLCLQPPFACVKCLKCGLRWLSPRPTDDAYLKIYDFENYFGGGAAEEDYEHVVARRRSVYIDRLKRIKKRLKSNSHKRILDVGAATGDFVYEARKAGFMADGLELSADARLRAKKKHGIELFGGDLENFRSEVKRYDVIHLHHVFEHISRPDEFLRISRKLLSQDGLLVLEIPQQIYNDLDRIRMVWQRGNLQESFSPYSLHHTYFYTQLTIRLLLERFGFITESLRTANPYYTPLRPFSLKNLSLFLFLQFSDKIHCGGNIIELFARKNTISRGED